MRPQSAKAKGRRLQQEFRKLLIEKLKIHPEDIESRSMGAGGEDLIMEKSVIKRYLLIYSKLKIFLWYLRILLQNYRHQGRALRN